MKRLWRVRKKSWTSQSTVRNLVALRPSKETLIEVPGTLESGHIYFLYRPKIDHGDDVGSIDDISK
jgi:hypothetical protein